MVVYYGVSFNQKNTSNDGLLMEGTPCTSFANRSSFEGILVVFVACVFFLIFCQPQFLVKCQINLLKFFFALNHYKWLFRNRDF